MVVLVDMMNVVTIAYSVAKKQLHERDEEFNEENKSFFFHMLLNKFNAIFREHGKLIICWEGAKGIEWRRSIFPDYKRNRDQTKAEDEYKFFISLMPELEELFSNYPCKQVKHEYAEGDDVIYSLAQKYSDEDDILIISGDNDLQQIRTTVPQIRIYNPLFNVTAKEKTNLIEEKAICGDSADNIPGLYRIGPKTFQKMIEDKAKWEEVMSKGNNREVYEKFKKIIDLSQFPEKYQKEIKDIEENTKYSQFNSDNIELFLWENRLQDVLQRWGTLKEEIMRSAEIDPVTQHFEGIAEEKVNRDEIEKTDEEENIDSIIDEFV